MNSGISGVIILRNSQEFLVEKFLRNSRKPLGPLSLIQFPKKSVTFLTKSWEFLKIFQINILEIFRENPQILLWNSLKQCSVPQKIRKIGDQFLKFLLKIQRNIPEKFSGTSWDYVSYLVAHKIIHQILRISEDYVFYSVP